ncbi:MAG: phosphatidate cytidylyltransferase [Hyphomicrobiaceae bacterium]
MTDGLAGDVSPQPPGNSRPPLSPDIRPRLLAGAVMAAVALLLAYAGPMPFAALVMLVALLLCWEWGRVVRSEDMGPALVIHAASVAAAVVLGAIGHAILGLVALSIGAVLLLAMPFGPRRILSAAGVFYVGLPALALLWLRSEEPLGLTAILFIFAVVWSSDIAAFVAGRTLGGPKLWPRVSPKKTWSGFAGGLAAVATVGAIFAGAVPGATLTRLVLVAVLLGLTAQAGDLAESALKRVFGVKDSSTLIPGHGGVMDRADSIVAVAVAAAMIALGVDATAPATALLVGR